MLRIVPDPEALAREAAAEFVRAVAGASTAAQGGAAAAGGARLASVALAGGSTPRALYALLADPAGPFRDRVAWERLHVFWGDERRVPPDDPESNYALADAAMLARVPVLADNVHRMRGEAPDAPAEAARYEADLRAFFGAPAPALPRFDLVLLGLGADGHTASLFPDDGAVVETARLASAVPAKGPRSARLTLTPPVLSNASRILFLVSGAGKAEALRAALEGTDPPDRLPARAIRPAPGRLLWIADRDAARLLRA